MHVVSKNMPSRFSGNTEAFASELLENMDIAKPITLLQKV